MTDVIDIKTEEMASPGLEDTTNETAVADDEPGDVTSEAVEKPADENDVKLEDIKKEDTLVDISHETLVDLYKNASIYINNLEMKVSAYEGTAVNI